MNKEELVAFAKKQFEESPLGYNKRLNRYKDELIALDENYDGNFKRTLYNLFNDIHEIPLCTVCKEKTCAFRDMKIGYGKTCSTKCAGYLSKGSKKRSGSEKRKKTNIERYGAETPLQNSFIKQKQETTMLEKYGSKHAVQIEVFKTKMINTNNEKYGVDHYFQTEESAERSSKTAKEKHANNFFRDYFASNYGVDTWYQTEEGIRSQLQKRNAEYLLDEIEKHLNGDKIFYIAEKHSISPYMIAKILDFKKIEYRPISYVSTFEKRIREYIESIEKSEIVYNDRNVLEGKEIDIFIPEKNIAIECNGVYWHTSKFKHQNYHYEKFDLCASKGIQLLQITDLLYEEKQHQWERTLKAKLNLFDKRIYARKCSIIEIDNVLAKKLLEDNHLQGYANASINIALMFEGEIVCLGSFMKSRYNKEYNYELVRFCSFGNYIVTGGFAKIIKHFEKEKMKKDETIISYSNCSWSNGNVYKKNGFEFIGHSGCNYVWTDGKTVIPRYKTQKQKLLNKFGENVKTENSFMNSMNMYKYYDAGNYKWIYKKQ